MFRTASIRFRLTAWYALIMTAGLALFSILLWVGMRERLLHDIHRDLEQRAPGFEAFVKNEASTIELSHLVDELQEYSAALSAGHYLELRRADGTVLFRHNAAAREGRDGFESVHGSLTGWGGTYTYDLGASRRPMNRALDVLEDLLWMLVPGIILISGAGGIWLSKRALRPVDDLTAAARNISIENLSSRLPVPRTGDELERLATVWNATLARLDSAVATLSQFAADASHELRTPLAIIRTSAELALRRERTPESYRQSLAQIAAEAERMTQLVEDLLFLAHRSAPDMSMSAVDLRSLLRETAAEVRELANVRRLQIEIREGAGDAIVSGNDGALRRLLLVLLDNAIKYSHLGGKVILECSANATSVEISLQDFGVGIEAAELPHILNASIAWINHEPAEATGLGLSLGESIAVAHGASIHVTSEPGNGSTFRMIFPRRFTGTQASTSPLAPATYSGS